MSSAGTVKLIAGRYRLDHCLASGRFAEVWRGTDEILARPVAVKLLHADLAGSPEALARLRDEARDAGSLAHGGIVRVYDYDEPASPDRPFLVMEFVDGPSLADVLVGGPLEPGRVMDIVAQAAAALQAAHQAGLANCAVTPENILLSRDGLVKLTHFVLSRAGGPAASDLYSLGEVAYRCLAGEQPSGGPPSDVALAHQHRPAPPLPPTVPAEVAALISQLMAEDPADRPGSAGAVASSAGELRDRLDPQAAAEDRRDPVTTHLATPAVPMRPRPLPARTGTSRGRTRREHRALLAAAAVLTALTAWALVSVVGPVAQHPAAEVPPRISMVDVNAGGLIGRTVAAAARRLHHLGLVVRVLWRSTDQAPPGIVVSVRPAGRVASGSVVVVVGARPLTFAAAPGLAGPSPGNRPIPPSRHHGKHRPHRTVSPDPSGRPTPTQTSSPAPTTSPSPGPDPTASPSPSSDPASSPSPSPPASPAGR
jgi:serine/threonine-protein kinase